MISVDYEQVVYNGNGIQNAWPYSFPIYDGDVVRLILLDADGTETDITQDYFVDVPGSTVYYPGYAPGAEPPLEDQPPKVQSGQKLIVYRDTEITQDSDLGDSWPFNVIEKGLDKLTMILQEKAFALARCLKISQGQAAEIDDYDTTIPLAADKVICGNADGNGFEAREAMMEVNGYWDGEGRQIKTIADPTDPQDAATKKYVNNYADGSFMKLKPDGTAWDSRNLPVSNVATPALVHDAATKDYVDRILDGYSGQGERFALFDSVAQMRAADLIPSQMVATMGYYDPHDGGHGAYVIRAKLVSDVDDGGSIIILDNDNVAVLITDGTVNVRQFGAVGNANYTDYSDGKLYESISLDDAVVAPYKDNVNLGWYVNAVFATEGIYEHYGQHFASYDIDTDTYSDLAPYYDNVADKWYVTATYSDRANAWVDGVWYYGATFDTEAADDTTAIQNAINAGLTIVFPQGNYAATKLVVTKSNTSIIGKNAILVRNTGSEISDAIINFALCDNIRLENITLDGRNPFYGINQYRANIRLGGNNYVTIENVVSKYAYGDGIYVTDRSTPESDVYRPMRNLTLRNCDFVYNCRNGMSVICCDGLVAENCHFDYTGRSDGGGHAPQAGVDLEPNNATEYAQNITFINCFFEHNNGSGLACKGNTSRNVKVTGCVFNDDYIFGVDGCANGLTIVENSMFFNMNLFDQHRDASSRACISIVGTNAIAHINNVFIQNSGGDGIIVNACFVTLNNIFMDSIGLRGLNLRGNTIGKNIKILNTYSYRAPTAYNASIYLDGENISLENIKIINDENAKTPLAEIGIKVRSVSFRNMSLHTVDLIGTFVAPIEQSKRLSSASDIYLNGNLVKLSVENNTGATMYNHIFATSASSAPTKGSWRRGDRVYNYSPSAGGYEGWVCTTAGAISNKTWTANTSYDAGDVVYLNSLYAICTKAGDSGATAPTIVTNEEVTDGTVVWLGLTGTAAVFKGFGTIEA